MFQRIESIIPELDKGTSSDVVTLGANREREKQRASAHLIRIYSSGNKKTRVRSPECVFQLLTDVFEWCGAFYRFSVSLRK